MCECLPVLHDANSNSANSVNVMCFIVYINKKRPVHYQPEYPRWESNPNLRFRKPPFYPLNYKGAPAVYLHKKRFGHEDTYSYANI